MHGNHKTPQQGKHDRVTTRNGKTQLYQLRHKTTSPAAANAARAATPVRALGAAASSRGSAGPGAIDGVTDTELSGASEGVVTGDSSGATLGAGDMGAMVGGAMGAATGAVRSGEGANTGGRVNGGSDAGAMAMGGRDTGDGVA
jgi:hypothetical protein